jgi:cystathionine beta-synthase
MREHGFMNPDSGMGAVSDLQAGRESRTLITVPGSAQVSAVIGLLKMHGVSQLPVVDDEGGLLGIITETRLLERALEGSRAEVPVSDLVQADYCTVADDTEVTVLTDLFRRSKVAIVVHDHKPSDIITRIDLIDYMSRIAGRK